MHGAVGRCGPVMQRAIFESQRLLPGIPSIIPPYPAGRRASTPIPAAITRSRQFNWCSVVTTIM